MTFSELLCKFRETADGMVFKTALNFSCAVLKIFYLSHFLKWEGQIKTKFFKI